MWRGPLRYEDPLGSREGAHLHACEGFLHTRRWADSGADMRQCSVHRPTGTGLVGMGTRVWLSGVIAGPSRVPVLQVCREFSYERRGRRTLVREHSGRTMWA